MSDRDAHIAIMVAAARGVGLRLSADEVWALSQDEAIVAAATNGLDEIDWPGHADAKSYVRWEKIKRYRKGRIGKNFAV
jgi:hypothetical protein